MSDTKIGEGIKFDRIRRITGRATWLVLPTALIMLKGEKKRIVLSTAQIEGDM